MDRSQSKIDFWSNSEKLRPTEQIYHLEHKKTFLNQNVEKGFLSKTMTKIRLDLLSHDNSSSIELGQRGHYSSTIEKDQGLLFAAFVVMIPA